MINTKRNRKHRNTKKQKRNVNTNSFFSLKNKREVYFDSAAERCLMKLMEFDPSVESYQQFGFKMFGTNGSGELESSPGLIVERKGQERNFVVMNDLLANNKQLAQGIADQMHKGEARPITLNVIRPAGLETGILPTNVEFLYEYVLLPACREDFPQIKEIVEICGEVSIAELKHQVKNRAAIYQLIFHCALQAPLDVELVSDDTVITAIPSINSIIKNL